MARSGRGNVKVSIQSEFDNRGVRQAERSLGGLDTSGKRLASSLGGLGHVAGVAAVAGVGLLAVEAKRAFDAFDESRKVARQTEAVIKSTGGAAGVTADQVSRLAESISKKTGVDDEAIQRGENLLLTFKNVHNEAGRGNDIFNRATRSALDLSTAGFGSLETTSKQLGKALNDPVKGMTALSRSGVTFTQQQKDQITTLVESNRTLDAQRIILKEVESQVGGSAEATATNTAKMKVAFENLEEGLGRGLAPVVDSVAGKLTNIARDAEGPLNQVSKRISKIFDRDDLDLSQKLSLSVGVVKRRIINPLKRAFERSGLGEDLQQAVEDGLPKVMAAVTRGGTRAAGLFVRSWLKADSWTQLITAGFIIGKLGGFRAAGTWAADAFGGSFGKRMSKSKQLETAGATGGARFGKAFGVAAGVFAIVEINKALGDWADKEGVGGGGGSATDSGSSTGGPYGSTRAGVGLGRKLAIALGLAAPDASGLGPTISSKFPSGGRSSGSISGLRTGPVSYPGQSGTGVNSGVKQLASATAGIYGHGLTAGTGKVGHSKYTTSGNVSDHYGGNALDIPASGQALIRMGQAALIAAGASEGWAHRQTGGLYNIKTPGGGRAQIIFNTQQGGDHTDHLHIGLQGSLGTVEGKGLFGKLRRSAGRAQNPLQMPQLAALNRRFPTTHVGDTAGQKRLSPMRIRQLAEAVGFTPTQALHMAQIAKGESSLYPGMVQRDPGDGMVGYGLLQMTPGNVRANWGPEALAYFEKLGGRSAMLNPVTNLKMAKYLFDHGGIGHWKGTAFLDMSSRAKGSVLPKGAGGGGISGGSFDFKKLDEMVADMLIAPVAQHLGRTLASPRGILNRASLALGRGEQRLDILGRRAGLVDEDLATAEGRAARGAEITGLIGATVNVGYQQNVRLSAIRQKIRRYQAAIKSLRAQLKQAPAGSRGRIRGRIRKWQAAVKDLRDEARELGFTIESLGIDVEELQLEGASVAAGGDVEMLQPGDSVADPAVALIDRDIAAAVFAGDKGAERAAMQRKRSYYAGLLPAALLTPDPADETAIYETLTSIDEWLKQVEQNTEDTNRLMQQQIDIANQKAEEAQKRAAAAETYASQFPKWLADVVSGEVGGRVGLGMQSGGTPGVLAGNL